MFYRRRSVFCRLWLNDKTFTHTAFLTHANHATHAKISTYVTHAKILWNHATHAKISTQAIHVTHAKILWTHATHATLAKIWPTLPTNPRHPRDLADWFSHKDLIFLPLYFVLGQVLSISGYDLLNRRMSRKQNYCIMAVKIPSLILFRFCLFFWLKNHLFCVLSLL